MDIYIYIYLYRVYLYIIFIVLLISVVFFDASACGKSFQTTSSAFLNSLPSRDVLDFVCFVDNLIIHHSNKHCQFVQKKNTNTRGRFMSTNAGKLHDKAQDLSSVHI